MTLELEVRDDAHRLDVFQRLADHEHRERRIDAAGAALDQAVERVTRIASGRMEAEKPGKPSKPDDLTN